MHRRSAIPASGIPASGVGVVVAFIVAAGRGRSSGLGKPGSGREAGCVAAAPTTEKSRYFAITQPLAGA